MPTLPKFLQKTRSEIDSGYAAIKSFQKSLPMTDPRSPFSVMTGYRHTRNRYSNVVPYEHTRVKLKVESGFDDYINASHIELELRPECMASSDMKKKRYIASQGPTQETVDLFWHMCFDEVQGDDIVVVMVTPLTENGMEKCFKYWPNTDKDGQTIIQGGPMFNGRDLVLEYSGQEMLGSDCTVTRFKIQDLQHEGNTKTVHHLYYDKWRDFSKPLSLAPVKQISTFVNNLRTNETDPIFVHCSAGVGRSGTFIALDFLLTSSKLLSSGESCCIEESSYDEIYDTVLLMRKQRMLMVERDEQFQFIYDSLKKHFISAF